ncbi:uncharacterized protein LOC122850815 [Aphidius gifuensis]|uniref:uncharacterized protein LOC122850815 n=1 Tax=Aphidius gifuensis TaxID=684658 RepID=UPI001CDB83BA|nr:uncharacterized protein LOC122850815 [Aphidius gifuensis]
MESSTSRGDSQIPDDVESMDCNDDGQAPIIQGQAGEQKSDGQAGEKISDDQAGGQRPDDQAGGQRPADAALWAHIPDVTERPRTSMDHVYIFLFILKLLFNY